MLMWCVPLDLPNIFLQTIVSRGLTCRYFQLVKEISDLEPNMQQLTDEELKAKTAEFRQRLKAGAQLDDLLVEAFAVVREVSSRVLRLRHFDAQLVSSCKPASPCLTLP